MLKLRLVNSSKNFCYKMYSSSSTQTTDVVLNKINSIGCITLNRPKQLNALNLTMVQEMQKQISDCEKDDKIKTIIVKGAGETAFCAGGDVKSIRDYCLQGKRNLAMEFFKEEYKLNYQIANCKKPYIAMINGITMGGGVGVSVHGRYRIATEKTVFAMPETAIGFFADVGGSYFLSRLRDKIGIYLVLTGNRLKSKDVKRTGIATHYMDSKVLANFEKELYEMNAQSVLEDLLRKYDEKIVDEFDASKILANFNESKLENIISNLEKDASDWSKQQLKLLGKMSPTSLKIAIRQLELGHNMSLKECFEMEYRMGLRFTLESDFSEGVRAVLIDRGDTPKWKPATISEVDDKKIEWYFKALPDDEQLVLGNNSKL